MSNPKRGCMLTPSEFEEWCRELQLSPAAREVIAAIRRSRPARRVTSRAKNVSGAYPSRKMGVTIQFESHTVELWAIYLMEHDPDVFEFYEQPQTFKFRYHLMDDGTWRCPPGEEYAESLGLSFHVCSSASLSRTYIGNLIFLEDYIGFMPTVPHQVQARLVELVRETPGIPLGAVVGDGSGIRANDVYAMLGQDMLYTDLHAAHLLQTWRAHLYLDQAQALAYTHLLPVRVMERGDVRLTDPASALAPNALLLWDGRPWTVVNSGETTITLLPEVGLPMQVPAPFFLQLLDAGTITLLRGTSALATHPEVERLMAQASPTNLRTANERFRLVQAYLA